MSQRHQLDGLTLPTERRKESESQKHCWWRVIYQAAARKTEDLTFKPICSVSGCVWTTRRRGGDISHVITPPVQTLCCSVSTQFDFIQGATLTIKIAGSQTVAESHSCRSSTVAGQRSTQLNPQRPLWAERRARTCCRMRLVVLKRSRCSSIKRLETSQISWSGKPWMG